MELSALINTITNSVVNHFDFGYMITVNIATYIFIQVWDNLNGNKVLTTWQKRLMLILAILIIFSVYILFSITSKRVSKQRDNSHRNLSAESAL